MEVERKGDASEDGSYITREMEKRVVMVGVRLDVAGPKTTSGPRCAAGYRCPSDERFQPAELSVAAAKKERTNGKEEREKKFTNLR